MQRASYQTILADVDAESWDVFVPDRFDFNKADNGSRHYSFGRKLLHFPGAPRLAVRKKLNSPVSSQMNCVQHAAESFEMGGNSMEILL